MIIEGVNGAPLLNPGVPVAGTDEVETLTIGGTPTAGSFKLAFEGFTTGDIAWSSTNATLLANINAALQALASIGASGVVATAGTLTAGIGTILLTFGANRTRQKIENPITVAANNLTGTAPTLGNAVTTPGVTATARGAAKGHILEDTTNGKLYINTGTPNAPSWTVVGTQT